MLSGQILFVFLFAMLTLSCVLCRIKFGKLTAPQKKISFNINVSDNPIHKDYLEKMEKQTKDNSRLLDGTGKMHFIEKLEEGSCIAKEKNINILVAIGDDRFS